VKIRVLHRRNTRGDRAGALEPLLHSQAGLDTLAAGLGRPSRAGPAKPGPRGLLACRVEWAASAQGRSLGLDSGPTLFFGYFLENI
jgi:hypothetical protein